MVKSWLASSRWSRQPSPLAITVIVNEKCMSVGDACRDLDEKGVVRGDFLLVGAGLVAGGGLALDLALERHKQRVGKDKYYSCTLRFQLTTFLWQTCGDDNTLHIGVAWGTVKGVWSGGGVGNRQAHWPSSLLSGRRIMAAPCFHNYLAEVW